jgi:broad-specificity NMP kinase
VIFLLFSKITLLSYQFKHKERRNTWCFRAMSENNSLITYITGVPGTGKTSIAKQLAQELNLKYLEVNDLVIQHDLYFGYDINRDTLIVDDELLIKRLKQEINLNNRICIAGGMIFENVLFDLIIVVHSSIPTLRKRLLARSYDDDKMESNLESEIMNVIYYELLEYYSSDIIYEVMNDNRTVKETCDEILSIIEQHRLGITKRTLS